MKRIKIVPVIFLVNVFFLPFFQPGVEKTFSQGPVIVQSPDKTVRFVLESRNGQLSYSVTAGHNTLIASSSLGLTINGENRCQEGIVNKITRYKIDQAYPYRGVHSTAVNKCNGATIAINQPAGTFTIEAKVFNDGVAFRYIVPFNDSSVVEKDNTQFMIPAGSTVWSQPNIAYYEGRYSRKEADTIRAGERMGPPVTIQLSGQSAYAVITEGGLSDFSGMSLVTEGGRSFRANLSGKARCNGEIKTPWRIIVTGRDLNTLVNTDIIANVSAAYDKKLFPKGYQTDWVKPGRSVWSWLAGRGPVTLDNMKRFSDFAASLGFEYNLVDEGWGNWKDSTRNEWDMMKELVDYSAKKNVRIWAWKAYPDRRGIAGINTVEKRRAFFKKCKDIGIAGLKIDFFDSESQPIINFYQAALKDAAEYQLMIDFHGANKPTGEARTWPNEMTREAVRGMENRPPWAPTNTIIPFTRYLAGAGDYTPVHFGDRMGEVSWAHHVASLVIFTSPLLCIGADPQSILENPCKEMIQHVPPTWDETVVLPQSKIGERAVFARRKGNEWFLAVMSSTPATSIQIKTDFLGAGNYTAYLVEDNKDKQDAAAISTRTLNATNSLQVQLNTNGGFVARFEKKPK